MEQRAAVVALMEHGRLAVQAVCELYGVSRKTAYKWRGRYQAAGLRGLEDRSRAPHTQPTALTSEERRAILALRTRYPQFGPKKLRHLLRLQAGPGRVPATSTIGLVLQRAGRVPARRRHPARVAATPLRPPTGPNTTWAADYKGEFRLGDRSLCYPLTITDGFSRFLLRAHGQRGTQSTAARAVFESAFAEYGLPEAIRTDKGAPFCSHGPAGLTRLSVWWTKLGIRHERVACAQQNGRHERMHRTLKAYVTRPPAATLAQQQDALERFRTFFNTTRPHEALAMQTPATVYRPSARPYDGRARSPDYPGHFECRRVRSKGQIIWRSTPIFISAALAGEPVGLEAIEDAAWRVTFGALLLGYVLDDELDLGLIRPNSQRGRLVLPMSPV